MANTPQTKREDYSFLIDMFLLAICMFCSTKTNFVMTKKHSWL